MEIFLNSARYLLICALRMSAIVLGFLCAAPSGSEIISSTTPKFKRSFAVSFNDFADIGAFSAFFHNIAAQPSGEMTE